MVASVIKVHFPLSQAPQFDEFAWAGTAADAVPQNSEKSRSFASNSEYRPELRRRPFASMKMQSQFLTKAGRCAITMIVFFPRNPATTSTIAASVTGSKFDVPSSITRTSGSP